MPRREFARVGTDMPEEESIKALSVEAGWLYDRLYLRPEMSRCGVIPYRPAAWALLGKNATEPKVRRWVRELVAGEQIVTDEPMAEVLIRTFVRWDGLLAQPNVVANMVYDFRRIWDLDIPDAWRGGWLLAVGQYPRAKHAQDDPAQWPVALTADALARLRKAVGPGFRAEFADALNRHDLKPFDEHSAYGIPEPFADPTVNPSQMALA